MKLVRFVSTEAPRINQVGIQYLSKYLDGKVFPSKKDNLSTNGNLIEISKKYLDSHKLLGKPTNIQKPLSFEVPELTAPTLDEHFRKLALYASEPYKKQAINLSKIKLPQMPNFQMKSGWLKYIDGNAIPVPYPDEDAIVFDVETLYKVSNYPIIAVACSETAWYGWCSPILTNESTSFNHLIPLNTINKEQVIVGHNVGYDRARVREEYELTESKAFYLDTMSLHIAVSGMCSQQRAKWMERKKAQKKEEDDDNEVKQLEIDDPWLKFSSPNSLKEVANFYFNEKVDKDIRDSFAGEDIDLIRKDFINLINYCANDVFITHKIYSKVLPEFLKTCSHPVSFSALKFMGSCILPTNEKWFEYLNNAESLYLKNRKRIDDRLIELAENAVKLKDTPEVYENDEWLSQLDWTINPIKLTKKGEPFKNQKLPGYPKWYKDLYSSKDSKLLITTRTRVTPLLLKLKYENYPVYWNEVYGWCFKALKDDYNRLIELNYSPIPQLTYDNSKVKKMDESNLPNEIHFKISNPASSSSSEMKTTQLLSKSNIHTFESGILKSDEPFAQEALELNLTCSYWISARDRIKSQFVVNKDKDLSLILPQVITMGTITRRAVEKTWLTASNAKKNRIGSELKSKIKAPDTHCFVGADVDSEELWIASLVGDSITSQHGGTAIGWMTLEGAKKDGTDLHSRTAKILGIDRNQSKIFNYGRIYGAGVKYAASLLKNFNPTLTEKECQERAKNLYMETKGQTLSISLDGVKRKIWYGGSESVLFNELERIANLEEPKTPVLKAGITRALMKKNLNVNSFLPSRINWAIQSSGVDYLHLLIVSMNYLIKKYSIDARLSISVHDEIRYLCSKKDKYRIAMALQISNLWTRAMFTESFGIMDLPQSCAFFSAVDIDHIFRKEVDMDCITPSNSIAETSGESLDINELLLKGENVLLKNGLDIKLPELDKIEEVEDNNEINFKYSYENLKWKEVSLEMQTSQNKTEVQRLLRDYKKNYGRLEFKDVLTGELVDDYKPKIKSNVKLSRSGKVKKEIKKENNNKEENTPLKIKKVKKEKKENVKETKVQNETIIPPLDIQHLSIDEIAGLMDTSSYFISPSENEWNFEEENNL